MADPNRDWMKDTKGRPYYTVIKTDDTPPKKIPDGWDEFQFREKRDICVRILGTAKGRNLISTALAFFLKHGKMSQWDRDIATMFRTSLFNCHPVEDIKVKREDG